MEHARAHGYPVPAVERAHGPELVLERIDGPTMLADLLRRPWRLRRHARTLAELHRRLHRIPAPEWLATPFGPESALLHLDLHPDNVLLGPSGPVVIDWVNAARGPPAADVAQTWILVATSLPPGGPRERLLARAGRSAFLRLFLAEHDEDAAARRLPEVAAARLEDPNVPEEEREAIRRLAPSARRAIEHP